MSWSACALRERLAPGRRWVVVGAGFLGAEAAAVAWRLVARVTLLEPASVPLAHAVGEQVGQVLAQAHVDHGVPLRTGASVTEVTDEGVRLADGEEVEELLSRPAVTAVGDDSLRAYMVAKRANHVRVEAVALAWNVRGARINTVSPGVVSTAMSKAEAESPHGGHMLKMLGDCGAGRTGTPG
ncbi:FAD-dependent oxidoreductase [Streptomyces sp. 3213.3]|uniref:FAD-dependent oxidoreductase n=1 Tax=Streptomyces sp. 3213.3 TaxID=1855348 RepID=UPI003FA755D2